MTTALKPRGLVMVTYYDLRAAQLARGTLQGTLVRSQPLEIHFYNPAPKAGAQDSGVNQVRALPG